MNYNKNLPTIGYFVAFISLGMSTAALGPTLPSLAANTGSQLDQISFLFTAHSLGYLLGAFQGGRLYDRVPGHPVIAAVLLVMGATLFLTPLISALWLLAAVTLLLGVGAAALDVGGNTLLVWVHGEKVGPYMNGLHFFFGVGASLSPVIIAQIGELSGGITWPYWVLGLCMVPAAVWLVRRPSPTAPASNDSAAALSAASPAIRRHEALLVVLIATLLLLYVGAEASFGGWIFTYSVDLGLAGKASAAYLTSAFWGALTLGRLLAIPIASRLAPRRILFADLVMCLASVAVILLWPHSPAALWLGAIGVGLGMASVFPTAISMAERLLPISGRITGWFLVGASLGGMSLPFIIGQLYAVAGPQATIISIAVDLVLAFSVLVVLTLYSTSVDRSREVVV